MKKFPLSTVAAWCVAILVAAAPVAAQDTPLEIKGDGVATVKIDRVITIKDDVLAATKFPFTFRAPADAVAFRWSIPAGVAYTLSDGEDVATVTAAPGGYLTVSVVAKLVDWDAKKIVSRKYSGKILIPGPTPDPKPDNPPTPPVPVPTGLRVVFVRETADPMTKEQLAIFNSTKIAAYLDAKVAKTNGSPDWRKFDKDATAEFENPTMKKLWAAIRPQIGALPAMVIVTDQKGEVFPLPATEQETLDLLKKYGG